MALCVFSNPLALKKVDLKKVRFLDRSVFILFYFIFYQLTYLFDQIISAPEVTQVLPDLPILGDLIKNVYECHLLCARDRVKAHSQLLESYRSLTVDSSSAAFGVSAEFIG